MVASNDECPVPKYKTNSSPESFGRNLCSTYLTSVNCRSLSLFKQTRSITLSFSCFTYPERSPSVHLYIFFICLSSCWKMYSLVVRITTFELVLVTTKQSRKENKITVRKFIA